MVPGTFGPWVLASTAAYGSNQDNFVLARGLFLGKPTARWGRKARDLRSNGNADRPVAGSTAIARIHEVTRLKSNLARLSTPLVRLSRYGWALWAVLLMASMALTLGAGIKWDW